MHPGGESAPGPARLEVSNKDWGPGQAAVRASTSGVRYSARSQGGRSDRAAGARPRAATPRARVALAPLRAARPPPAPRKTGATRVDAAAFVFGDPDPGETPRHRSGYTLLRSLRAARPGRAGPRRSVCRLRTPVCL